MNNSKTTAVIVISIALTVYVLFAIWSGVQPGNEAYKTKTEAVVRAEPASVESIEMTDVVDESITIEQPAVVVVAPALEQTIVADTAPADTATMESVVEDTATAVVDDVAEAIETVAEQVEAVVDNNNKENEVEGALYSVVEGNKLDPNSYEGFKLYRNWCARCHGTYGQGMVGPNLADSLKIISEKQFFDTVENGKTGTIGSMPSWKANVQVMEGRDQLYAYLKARSDGAIGEVKPKKQ
ncbi:MAG: c-type cytochrome [Gammaproteobacteria bacterium]|nr:c-type cytochrome [Gammaproteobacteria bacterium]